MSQSFPQLDDFTPERDNFPECVAQHVPYLTRVVCNLMRGAEGVDDIVQQTLVKALTHADQFRCDSALKTWLTAIAINEVRQTYRCGWRKRAVPLKSETLPMHRVLDVGSPYKIYEETERDLLIREAVSRLPSRYRTVLEACEFHSVPTEEAARKLGITLPALKTRRHRAREKLLPLLAKLSRKAPRESASRARRSGCANDE